MRVECKHDFVYMIDCFEARIPCTVISTINVNYPGKNFVLQFKYLLEGVIIRIIIFRPRCNNRNKYSYYIFFHPSRKIDFADFVFTHKLLQMIM